MSQQGGEVSFRVNAWDVLAVLFNTLTGIFGHIAGMCHSLAQLAVGQSNYIDDQREFQLIAQYDIERISDGG